MSRLFHHFFLEDLTCLLKQSCQTHLKEGVEGDVEVRSVGWDIYLGLYTLHNTCSLMSLGCLPRDQAENLTFM